MQEVWIPEAHQLDPRLSNMPRCNIFMTNAFRHPERAVNRGKRALVLI